MRKMNFLRSLIYTLLTLNGIRCQVSKVTTTSTLMPTPSTSISPVPTPTISPTTRQPVTIKPPVTDPCDPNPCQHGGSCSSSGSTVTCTCLNGYHGSSCETKTRSVVISTTFTLARVLGQVTFTVTLNSPLRQRTSPAFLSLCNSLKGMIRAAIPFVLRVHCIAFRAGSIISDYSLELSSTSNVTYNEMSTMISDQLEKSNYTTNTNETEDFLRTTKESKNIIIKDYDECSKNIEGFCDASANCKNTIDSFECTCSDDLIQEGNKCVAKTKTEDNERLALYITIGVISALLILFFLLILVSLVRRRRYRKEYPTESFQNQYLVGRAHASNYEKRENEIDWELYRANVQAH